MRMCSFEGRTTRSEWWLGVLSLVVIVFGGWVGLLIGVDARDGGGAFILAFLLFYAVTVYLNLALHAKRWHDLNKSGWWTLVTLVPIIGGFWLIIELGFLKGTDGPNKYGPSPYGVGPIVSGDAYPK